MHIKTKKAIIYSRFSPRRHEETCCSIDQQTDSCHTYATSNGLEVLGEYSDEAMSGSTSERPGLWDAIAALPLRGVLLVYRFDRLARDSMISYFIDKEVSRKKGQIISASGEGTIEETMAPDERLKIGILRLFAEYEREIINARTSAAMKRHQANGKLMTSKPPYGMMIDPDRPSHIIESAYEQEVIRIVHQLYKSGLKKYQIMKWLNESDYKTRTGNPWRWRIIRTILTDRQPKQIGMLPE